MAFVSFLGAVSLPLYFFAWRRGIGQLLGDLELRTLAGACVVGTLLLALWFWQAGAPMAEALRQGGLLAVSAQTTAGFSAQSTASLDAFPKGLLILSMAVGGSLVGKSMEFKRIVTRIEDPEFEHICIGLGLEDTIVPARTIGRYLADMFAGHDLLELSAMIKDEARVFSFVVREEDARTIEALDLPKDSRVICCYRGGKFRLPKPEDELRVDDEVVVITHSRNVPDLEERWGPRKQRPHGG